MTHGELQQYIDSTVQVMRDQRFVSLSGPDETKIGPDLQIAMAYIMNPAKSVVAVCMAQDSLIEPVDSAYRYVF